MNPFRKIAAALARRAGLREPLHIWHHPHYTLPLPDLEQSIGIETRRADLALWALHSTRNRHRIQMHSSPKSSYGPVGLVHEEHYLASLTQPHGLSKIFGFDLDIFPVEPILTTFRLAVGGTVEAAQFAARNQATTLNLLGGFHHAYPDRGAGLCAFNDVAIAIAVLRRDGFPGQINILDLDAHPPDGTAACVSNDSNVWVGSISGSDWGQLPGVDETYLPEADDQTYVRALESLLERMPSARLTFVLAGGDVLVGDRLGKLRLTLDGVHQRDSLVRTSLSGTGSVWLPAGGYRTDSWRSLAQTATVLIGSDASPLPQGLDPLASHFRWVSSHLSPKTLGQPDDTFSADEVDTWFGVRPGPKRFLGFYTSEGIEHALQVFGVLDRLTRLGYSEFEVQLSSAATGDRVQLWGSGGGARHLLWEMVVAREKFQNQEVGVIHWMTMRHPLGHFYPGRPKLPGQDAPGLGLAEEALHLVERMAERLHFAGVLMRPSWFHSAYIFRSVLRFSDPEMEADFKAILRDLGHLPLPELTKAIAAGQLTRDGKPWTWTASPMVAWRSGPLPEIEPSPAQFRVRSL